MKDHIAQSTTELGLMASGSSKRWDISVDESLDGDEWSLELDGPQVYLVFNLRDLSVLPRALQFLQTPSEHTGAKVHKAELLENTLILGRFGSASVSLVRDNEDFPRCFLVVGPRARSTLRISLDKEDLPMLSEALRQVIKDQK